MIKNPKHMITYIIWQINWEDKMWKIWKVYEQASDGTITNKNTEMFSQTAEKDVIFSYEIGKN